MWWACWPYAKGSPQSMFGYTRGVVEYECGENLDVEEHELDVVIRLLDPLYDAYGFPDEGFEVFTWEEAWRAMFLS